MVQESTFPPGEEWRPAPHAWTFLAVDCGTGYWRARSQTRQLSSGDGLLIVPGASDGHLLASRVEFCRARHVALDTTNLRGVLTLQESGRMDHPGNVPDGAWHWPKGSPEAFQLAAALAVGKSGALVERFRLLAGLVELLCKCLPQPEDAPEECCAVLSRDRLRRILGQVTEGDLIRLSVTDFADRLRCSPRHFSRLFTLLYGVSFREKQQKLRLNLARRLLETGDAKVLHVALESGYQSLGLFNALFKRHFAMTPGECRRRAQKRTSAAAAHRTGPSPAKHRDASQPRRRLQETCA